MGQPSEPLPVPFPEDQFGSDTTFRQEIERLYALQVYGRWFVVGISWLTIGVASLWGLRAEIELWLEHFTWTAVRYGLIFNRLPAIGLGLCIGMTLAVLLWQSRNILFGRTKMQQQRLAQGVLNIRKQGASHPLWQWVCRQ
jgi:hypothetical protein